MDNAKQEIQVLLFGSLKSKGQGAGTSNERVALKTPSKLKTLLKNMAIDERDVQLAMVNHRAVFKDHMVQPGDRVSLFPPEYAFFADWKGFRS